MKLTDICTEIIEDKEDEKITEYSFKVLATNNDNEINEYFVFVADYFNPVFSIVIDDNDREKEYKDSNTAHLNALKLINRYRNNYK